MGKFTISNFYFYRWRYALGAITLISVFIGLLYIAGFYAPNGLSAAEMTSASRSIHTPISTLNGNSPDFVLHLPYDLLQKLSISLLGVNDFSIKLPSLFMASFSVLCIYGVIRLWFRRNVAIITSIIAMASAQLLLLSQIGTPAISYIFWTSIILFSASMIAYATKYRPVWIVFTAIIAALSLYTPLSVYLLLTLLITSLVHPHARFIIFTHSKWLLITCVSLFLLLITPLVLSIINTPSLILDISGISSISAPTLASLKSHILPYVSFHNPSAGFNLQPVYGLAMLLLALLGTVRLFSAKYTAKSYIISLLFLFILIGLAVGVLPDAYTFIPVVILVAFAINYLISTWYSLFPFNPYARVAGLLPLAVLVIGVSFTEFDRYLYSYHYLPGPQAIFSKDLQLLDKLVKNHSEDRLTILVDTRHQSFYNDYAQRLTSKDKISITDAPSIAKQKSNTEVIIAAYQFKSPTAEPSLVSVTPQAESAARFYLYKNGY